MDVGELLGRARKFRLELKALKARLSPKDFAWYPYDSLSNLEHLDRLLTGKHRALIGAGGPVLDIGCADGDLAFFLESLGCRVQVIDNPASSHNYMRGVRALKEALGSRVEIHALDLDAQFVLPAERYDVVFFLGILYHLKNPVYVLEALAKQARYAVVSTRITGDRKPNAYLVDEDELNDDPSNYWMFSDSGLKRLLKRTYWQPCDYMTTGGRRDRRAFCLARSRYALGHLQLLEGWHAAEPAGYRWTRKEFSAIADVPRPGRSATLRLKFFLAPAAPLPLTLSAHAAGASLGEQTYTAAGLHTYTCALRPASETVRIDFRLDKAIPGDQTDPRERGIIVSALDLEPK
jgi:tRNA (mo5U34)-methyltransferase